MPDSGHPTYSDAPHRQRPTFNPTGFRPPSPSTGQRAAPVTDIQAERSQHEPDGKVWWWLTGDTCMHRELLKAQGACWNGKRKTWYWLQDGGLALWCVYHQHITDEAAAFLAKHSARVDVWALPGKRSG